MKKLLMEICNPKQWKTISTSELLKDGYLVYGANGVIGFYNEYTHEKPTLMITCRGATCGTLNISKPYSYINGNAMALDDLDKDVDIKYLYYYLRNRGLQDTISGSAQPQITRNGLSKVAIEYPEFEAQLKVVEVLDKAQELIDKRKEQIEALDELVKSKFIEMFGDLNINSKGWAILNFNEFAVIDTNMTKDFEKYADYPHIGIDSIEKNTGNILEYQLVKDCSLKSGKYLFDERHIIYSKIRPNLNKVALPQFEGVCSADAYPILCLDGIVDRSYLGYVLRSEFFLRYILAFSGRTNIPKVNKEQLKGFNMPTPPIELQNQFADFVKQVDKLKFEMEESLKELENNFNSLMQRAFKGKLFN